jgi:cyclopropane fatty-acyl-phospholipid synthase-like methyltransferase
MQPEPNQNENSGEEESRSIEDEKFDQIYPERIRKLSPLQWTPVRVAAEAAKLLVTQPGTRVLDIGCGPGKFCLVAAALSDGHFTGVEQRADLAAAAREAAAALRLSNVEIVQDNITNIAFADYDAFYLFNPFEENMLRG